MVALSGPRRSRGSTAHSTSSRRVGPLDGRRSRLFRIRSQGAVGTRLIGVDVRTRDRLTGAQVASRTNLVTGAREVVRPAERPYQRAGISVNREGVVKRWFVGSASLLTAVSILIAIGRSEYVTSARACSATFA